VAQQKTLKNLCQDRGQTEPGLVAFYNPPGNGAGLFFQPQSLHGAGKYMKLKKTYSGVGITPVIIISRWSFIHSTVGTSYHHTTDTSSVMSS